MIANALVVIIVVASVCYCVWKLGPSSMRYALRVRLARWFPRVFSSGPDVTTACDACGGCEAASKFSNLRGAKLR